MNEQISVKISADTSKYTSALAKAGKETAAFATAAGSIKSIGLDKFGEAADRAGRKLLPLTAAVGTFVTAGAKASASYERSFSTITGLVGVAADETDRLAKSTLSLAGATGRGPQELAKAMFTIQSAGIQGAAGMDALDIAAKSAAAGMGSTQANAQALTGALNAYRASGLTAAQAGDYLAATARAGNFEVAGLAGALGRVLPVASTLGVGLDQVGGAIALLTRSGASAAESVTQVRAVLNSMLAPSEATKKALESVGLTMNDLRNTLETDGIVAALEQMYEAAGRNEEQFAKMIGSQEAVGAAFSLIGASASDLEATFGQVANSTGTLQQAFDAAAGTADFKLEAALSSLKASLIEFGAAFAPAIAAAAEFGAGLVSNIVGAFDKLPGPIKTAATAFVGFAAAAGPLLIITAKMITALQLLGSIKFAASIASWAKGLAGFSSAGAAAGTALTSIRTALVAAQAGTISYGAAAATAGTAMKGFAYYSCFNRV